MQSQRDQNIVDAWRNGGTFNGQPVTDQAMLDYWNARLAKMSPKDPGYDSAKNTVFQFQYAIEQSKNELDYAQGKITAQQRGQFFLDWAAKVPKDSELYRTLQKNAAQFLQATKAQGTASASASQAKARDAADQATIDQYEAAGNFLIETITRVAQMRGDINPPDSKGNGGGTIDDLSVTGTHGGPLDIPAILQIINNSPAVIAYLKTLDPNAPDVVTQAYLEQATQSRIQGIQIRIDRAKQAGDMNGTNGVTEAARQVGAYDTVQTYEAARKAWLAASGDSTASPDVRLKAWFAYSTTLSNLANDPSTDPITAQALLDEASILTVDQQGNLVFNDQAAQSKTIHENFTRQSSLVVGQTKDKPNGDNAGTLAGLQTAVSEATAVMNGGSVLAYGTTVGGTFTPSPTGTEVRPVPAGQATAGGLELVVIPQSDGSTISVYAKGRPVVTTAKDKATNEFMQVQDASGKIVDSTTVPIATAYDITYGGRTIRVYKYKAADGTTRFTSDQIWGAGVSETEDPSKITLDLTGTATATQAGTVTNPKTVYDPSAAYDPVRNAAGLNSIADSLSLPIAVADASGTEYQTITGAIKADPVLRAQVIADATRNLTNGGYASSSAGGGGSDGVRSETALKAWQALGNALAGDVPGSSQMDLPGGYATAGNDGTFGPMGPQTSVGTVTGVFSGVPAGRAPSTGTESTAFVVKPLSDLMDVPGRLRSNDIAKRTGERDLGITPVIKSPESLVVPATPPGAFGPQGPQGPVPPAGGVGPIGPQTFPIWPAPNPDPVLPTPDIGPMPTDFNFGGSGTYTPGGLKGF